MPSKNLGEVASKYADKLGFHVFPLKEKSKVPATANGLHDASNDPATIKAWWEENPRYNIALRTGEISGVWVLDVDGALGETDLASLEAQHGALPKTTTQTTAKGRHLIFRYPVGLIIGNRAKLIRHDTPEGLDVRGNGGYIVLTPSIHPDSGLPYKWAVKPTECPPADAPQWLLDLVIKPAEPQQAASLKPVTAMRQLARSTSPDAIIDDQVRAIRSAPAGTRNDTLNIAALKVGRTIESGAISEGEARALLASEAAAIGLDQSEIMPTINSGLRAGMAQPYKYGGRSHDVQPVAQHDPETGEVIEAEKKPSSLFTFLSIPDIQAMPPVQWLVKDYFPQNSFGMIYGVSGHGKTFVALDFALCVATGKDWHGQPVEQGAVLYIVGEGVGGLNKRISAWLLHHEAQPDQTPFWTLPVALNMRDPEAINKLLASIDATGLTFSLVLIDTVARAIAGAEENSSKEIGEFVVACDMVKDHTGAAVIGVHHCGKDVAKGMRGSSSLLGAVDTSIMVNKDDSGLISVTVEKQKDSEAAPERRFSMTEIVVGIGQNSIVLMPSEQAKIYQKTLSRNENLAMQILRDCIAVSAETVRGQPATRIETWRSECYRRELTIGDNEAKRSGFRKASSKLQEKGHIGAENGLVWIVGNSPSQDHLEATAIPLTEIQNDDF